MLPIRPASLVLCALLLGAGGASAQEPAGFVGDATCLSCHRGTLTGYPHTVHARALAPREERARGACESCHGPGSAHVAARGRPTEHDVLRFRAGSPEDVARENEACLSCHSRGPLLHWRGGTHAESDVACSTCHAVKAGSGQRFELSGATETQLCAGCHPFQRSQGLRRAHMGVRDGKLECSGCHNAHGSLSEAMLVGTSVNDTCYACHADKRGPFLWEHPPVTENCLGCHEAHGSVRVGMLKTSQPRLCQECHLETLHPSEARLPANRFVLGSACLQCHPQVHGSNHPSGALLTR